MLKQNIELFNYSHCVLKVATFLFLNNSINNKPYTGSVFEPVNHTWKILSLYLVKCIKYHLQQQQQLVTLSQHENAFIFSLIKNCPLQLPCELTKLSNIQGSCNQKNVTCALTNSYARTSFHFQQLHNGLNTNTA